MTSKSGSSVKAPEPNPRRTLQPETSRLAPGGAYQRIGGPPNSSGTGLVITTSKGSVSSCFKMAKLVQLESV